MADAERLTQAVLEESRGNREELLGSGERARADRQPEEWVNPDRPVP